MIKKLKLKFILINMTFVISILGVVIGVFYYSNVNRFKRETIMSLMQSIDHNRIPPAPDIIRLGRKPKANIPPLTPVFVVYLNRDQSIKTIYERNISATKELATTLIQLVENKGTSQGILKDYSLRYLKIDTKDGAKIGFADLSYEYNNLKTLLINCLLIFFLAVILFLILSLYLSRLALKPVEAAWKLQNQFIADASHELKTPLTVILANLQILFSHRDCTIKEQEKWLINTKVETSRMTQLVEELLFLARSDAGIVQTDQRFKTALDFSDIVLNGVLLFESVAFESKINLENKIEPSIIINGCESQLKQLVIILLDNACKYAGKDGSVSVCLKKSTHSAILSVYNTGNYISSDEQKHIFERFYRTDQSRVRKEGGYGLGLSIAKTIINRHKGKIHVTSSLESGTVFTVSLPHDSRQSYTL
ncbi:HAMP domain-containing sensor histidine kinase [Clostridium sp. E02]|uniref:sensor histidine kinase n=1 Tax=Clostridium sp. E02 TaxID=2487134 RepID=UPI000F5447C8|nr:HAMP domain-containing sensor histidine kinase [Clostridium sp. E02]